MTCEEAEILLHALADGELDAGNARAIEAHVATCANCAQRLREIRDMREAFAGRALQFEAPASLRTKIEASLPTPAPRIVRTSRRSLLQGFA
ncbi:MAG: anti-sigma factor family protein, partial [Casimicrobiaceae bacterium]